MESVTDINGLELNINDEVTFYDLSLDETLFGTISDIISAEEVEIEYIGFMYGQRHTFNVVFSITNNNVEKVV